MVRNTVKSETRILSEAAAQIEQRLPPGWTLTPSPRNPSRTGRPDRTFVLNAPDGSTKTLAIEVKRVLEPRDVRQLSEQVRFFAPAAPVVVAPYLGARTRELLTEAGISYFDATGNTSVIFQRPALFIRTSGAQRDPSPKKWPLRSLRGPGAGRAVRALCDFRPPYGVRDLAARSNASAATLSRVIDLLAREALLERGPRGSVAQVDVPGVIRRWVQDYGFAKSNRVATYLDPRGISNLRGRLSQGKTAYTVTGSLAAAAVVTVAPPRLVQVFVDDIAAAAEALGLRETDAGANVVLAEPYDAVVFERATRRDGLVCVALSQVAADLLTSPGRAPAEAVALLDWMAKNEPRWRT